jgi:S-adenosylmethionine:tRNA ribosyltransferase-isomerase
LLLRFEIVQLSDFSFDLPVELIAQAPPAERGTSRLLAVDRATRAWRHHHIGDLPELLAPGDLIVVNDTRVIAARLIGHRDPSGGTVECLLLRQIDADTWDALMHPGQKMKPGTVARFGATPYVLVAEVIGRHTFGRRTIRLIREGGGSVDDAIDAIGHIPLPPYIKRPDAPFDRDRYQTTFARRRGSVAAPTAGLHFTPAILDALAARGVERAAITLHVGYGTFKPIRTHDISAHTIDAERYHIAEDTARAIERARRVGRRIIAVGTTTTRTLEAVAARSGGPIVAGSGEADLFITPGHHFRAVGGLLTNFHLPQSSLLVLVCAFAGLELVLDAYRAAIAEGYRFYSYGDAMLIL